MRPLISIGMPVYNNARTLPMTIRSLLNQTCNDWELLIIDDGSQDETQKLLRQYNDRRIKVITGRINRGLPARLNQAIELARGEFFARLDGDDICYPTRLASQVSFLEENRDVDLLGTRMVVFQDDGSIAGVNGYQQAHHEICRRPWAGMNQLAHPTWMGRWKWFHQYRYNTNLRKAQDRDILLRSYRNSQFACLPECLMGYRQDRLSLMKILKTRWYLSRSLFNESIYQFSPLLLRGVIEQALKAGIDTFSIATDSIVTGFAEKILAHRALPASDAEAQEWRTVWQSCQQTSDNETQSLLKAA